MPQVCLIIPIYNGLPHLRGTVEAALNQDFENYEILLHDDGSTDGSRDYLASLNDSRVRVMDGPGQGLAHNMNSAIQHTTAPYIARCDQDDLMLPHRLSTQYALIRDENWTALFTYITKFSKVAEWNNRERQEMTSNNVLPIESLKHGAYLHSTVMIKRQALIDLGGYRQQCYPCDDWDLQLRLEEYAKKHDANIGVIAQPLVRYRMHEAANTHQLFFEMQNKKRWVENNAIRRRSQQKEHSFSEYQEREKKRYIKNLNRKRKDLYHYHFRLAGEHFLNRNFILLGYHTLSSVIFAPERFLKRITALLTRGST